MRDFCPHFTRDSPVGAHHRRMSGPVKKFWADDMGATAIEHGSIAAISRAVVAVVSGMGAGLGAKFTSINSSLE
jgi:pilus assembly protein Flp/PilA